MEIKVGTSITFKNVQGELVTGIVTKINDRTIIVKHGVDHSLIRIKDLKASGYEILEN